MKTESVQADIENSVDTITPIKDVSDKTSVNTFTQRKKKKIMMKKKEILNIPEGIINLVVTNATARRLKR